MKNKITNIVLTFLFLSVISCGTIHEYPDEEEVLNSKLSLTFKFNKDDIDKIVHNPTLRTLPLAEQATRQVRYTIEIYKTNDDNSPIEKQYFYVERINGNEIEANFDLPAGQYYALAWVDYILPNSKNHLFYNTNSLKDIEFIHARGYDRSKEQFSGRKDITLRETELEQKEVVTMHRPGGKFRIIATDYDKYLNSGGKPPAIVAYTYHNSIYNNFNVYSDTPSQRIKEILLDGEITEFDKDESIIALDWVIIPKEGNTIEVSFAIYDTSGNIINEIPPIQFPIKRDMMTLVKGEFLTHIFSDDGGIGIDDEFEGEIEITIP